MPVNLTVESVDLTAETVNCCATVHSVSRPAAAATQTVSVSIKAANGMRSIGVETVNCSI